MVDIVSLFIATTAPRPEVNLKAALALRDTSAGVGLEILIWSLLIFHEKRWGNTTETSYKGRLPHSST